MEMRVVRRWLDGLAVVVVFAAVLGWLPLVLDSLLRDANDGGPSPSFWTRIYLVTERTGFFPGGFLLVALVIVMLTSVGGAPPQVPVLALVALVAAMVAVTQLLGTIAVFNLGTGLNRADQLAAAAGAAGQGAIVAAVAVVAFLVGRDIDRASAARRRVGGMQWEQAGAPTPTELQ